MNKEYPEKALVPEEQKHELSEDIEVVGPGLMLSEARNKISMTVAQVVDTLNFSKKLVNDIEQDIFNQSLPATFNRGYLRSYAKLVKVDVEDVLAAYELLGVAEVQRSEMQSFSNLTEKEAEHSRLMWLSYLIVAILFGLMVLWWLQTPTSQTTLVSNNKTKASTTSEVNKTVAQVDNLPDTVPAESLTIAEQNNTKQTKVESADNSSVKPESVLVDKAQVPEISTAVFTFSGDCWVKIFDATGERVAWGMKRLGYVMTITGQAPFKVTLGKPELATIVLNGQQVDMSSIDVNNIANFTLPLKSE